MDGTLYGVKYNPIFSRSKKELKALIYSSSELNNYQN
ncbi:MAG: hypothetical protein RLZZ381_1428 [Cyanobacteriota bacterium]|jgi:hypothetical protein